MSEWGEKKKELWYSYVIAERERGVHRTFGEVDFRNTINIISISLDFFFFFTVSFQSVITYTRYPAQMLSKKKKTKKTTNYYISNAATGSEGMAKSFL